ncbi:hypothetical protein [Dongia sedimenti]|uniref:Uncharacterized protein n=1 Tax=Dongia sedimenti TaxID=3064282 RepID=A0ABU0YHT0_9PROT|nr:hypothetical protein [Rhodospirillaceae bacterium R-7]
MRITMYSMHRAARRIGLSVIGSAAILLGLAGAAQAEKMKPQDIEDNRQTCMSACIEKTGNATGCQAYCGCSTEAMAAQITQEEYDAGKNAIASQQPPAQATVDKLTAIAKTCRPQLENN